MKFISLIYQFLTSYFDKNLSIFYNLYFKLGFDAKVLFETKLELYFFNNKLKK